MRLYLIRHAPVAVPEGTCYGRSDIELADDWPQRLAEITAKLPAGGINGTNLYTSPLTRCQLLADGLGPNAQRNVLLREMDFGVWEGQPWSDIPREEIDAWLNNLEDFRPPGGESLGEAYQRCIEFLDQIGNRSHENAFIMTHGGVICCLVAHALGLPLKNATRLQVDFGGVSILRIEAGLSRLECLNV